MLIATLVWAAFSISYVCGYSQAQKDALINLPGFVSKAADDNPEVAFKLIKDKVKIQIGPEIH